MFPPKGYCTCDWIHGLKWNWNSTRFDGVSLWYAWLALATLALDWAHAHRLEVWISLIGWPPFLLGSYRHPHWFSSQSSKYFAGLSSDSSWSPTKIRKLQPHQLNVKPLSAPNTRHAPWRHSAETWPEIPRSAAANPAPGRDGTCSALGNLTSTSSRASRFYSSCFFLQILYLTWGFPKMEGTPKSRNHPRHYINHFNIETTMV